MSKKIIFVISFLAVFGLLFNFGLPDTKATTAIELQKLVEQLQKQIAQLQQRLNEIQAQPKVWCHDFRVDLKYGDKGPEVEALQTALKKEGFYGYPAAQSTDPKGRFGIYTSSAVVGFQEKYRKDILAPLGLKYGTGVVGKTTRAKLNELYGCKPVQPIKPVKPYIKVLSPNRGEKWVVGSAYQIKWDYSGLPETEMVSIRWLDFENNDSYTIAQDYPIKNKSLRWTPSKKFITNKAKIEIIVVTESGKQFKDESVNYFSIALSPPCDSYGDVNGDGYITDADVNMLFGLIDKTVSDEQKRRGDVNGNGRLDFDDTLKLNEYLNGKIDTLPVCISLSPCAIDIYGKIIGEKPCLCNDNLCDGNYCCNGRTCQTSTCGPSQMNLAVILLTDISFYLVGDSCSGGDCCGVYEPNYETPIITFANNENYKMLKPSDPSVNDYSQKMLIRLELDPTEVQEIKSQINNFVSKVAEDSGGAIILNVSYVELPYQEITMSRWGCKFWIDPNNLKPLLSDQITKDTDFVLVFSDIHDSSQNACIEMLPLCGGMRGADWDFFGVSYNYIPKTNSCVWYNCAEIKTIYHEWLHQLDFALEKITGVPDIYQDNFPKSLCGNADPDSYKWFPSPDSAAKDPDFSACVNYYDNWSGYCDSIKPIDCDYQWDAHLLSKHYNPSISLIGNHCRNGKQDFNETGVDCGGHCKPCPKEEKSITVISPNGGEKWIMGRTYDITWTSQGVDWVMIVLQGPSSRTITAETSASSGKYSWTLPTDLQPGDTYKILIGDTATSLSDESDDYFSIIVEPDISASFTKTDFEYDSSQLQIFGQVAKDGETYYANLDGSSDHTYTTSKRYCSFDGEYHYYPDAWDIERKYISPSKYKILVRGSSDSDCGKGQPQNTGWIKLNPDSGWKITEVVKCNVSSDTYSSNYKLIDTYCKVNKKEGIIEWQSGSTCGGCCSCPGGASVNIEVIVEKEVTSTSATSTSADAILKSVGNQLASISKAVSQLMERIAELTKKR